MNITKIADEILEWSGPSGLCWCEELQKFIDPEDAEDVGCSDCAPIDRVDDPPTRFLRRNDNFEVGIANSSKKNKVISELSNEILDTFRDWYGPSGDCWCEKKKKFIDPDEADEDCPECGNLRAEDIRQFRYLHLHDDYKSF